MDKKGHHEKEKQKTKYESDTSDTSSISSERQVKLMRNRISYLEGYFGKFCILISEYMSKTASIRDKNDDIAQCIANFAAEETLNTTSKLAMTMVADLIGRAADHGNAKVLRLEAKVLPILSSFGLACKQIKTNIHETISLQEKVYTQLRKVESLKRKPANPKLQRVVARSINELDKMSAKSSRLNTQTQTHLIKFEQRQMQDLKECFLALFKIEIAAHAKLLEFYTEAYRQVDNIDEDMDLEALAGAMGLDNLAEKTLSNQSFSSRMTATADSEDDEEIKIKHGWTDEQFSRDYLKEIKTGIASSGLKQRRRKTETDSADVMSSGSSGKELSMSESETETKKKPIPANATVASKQKARKAVSFANSPDEGGSTDDDEKYRKTGRSSRGHGNKSSSTPSTPRKSALVTRKHY